MAGIRPKGEAMDFDATARAYLIAALVGLALWAATAVLGGRAEPWDVGFYWTVSYPLALIGAAVLGYAFPSRSWRWALVLVCSQLPVMMASGSGLGLLPLGLVLLAILSLPAIAVARFGASMRLRAG
jgi:hypothetical protein